MLAHLGRDDLIRIEMKHPLVPRPALLQPKVALAREVVKRATEYPKPVRPRDVEGPVGAAGVNYDDIITPSKRGKAAGQIALLVEGQQQDRDIHSKAHVGPGSAHDRTGIRAQAGRGGAPTPDTMSTAEHRPTWAPIVWVLNPCAWSNRCISRGWKQRCQPRRRTTGREDIGLARSRSCARTFR